MTIFSFDPEDNVIVCLAQAIGPIRDLRLRMIIDTGASCTIIPKKAAKTLGLAQTNHYVDIVTGTKMERLSVTSIPKFTALGIEHYDVTVLTHDLPTQFPADGVLGLNFLKKSKCVIDFAKNTISIPHK